MNDDEEEAMEAAAAGRVNTLMDNLHLS